MIKKELKMMNDNDKERTKNDKERIKNDKERIKNEAKINELLNKSNEVFDINKHISNKLDVAVIDRVPKTVNKSKLNCFVLLKNHDDTYYTIRCQRRRITSTLKKYKAKFDSDDQPIELLRFDYNPNSINLVNRINPLMTGLFASFATVHL